MIATTHSKVSLRNIGDFSNHSPAGRKKNNVEARKWFEKVKAATPNGSGVQSRADFELRKPDSDKPK